MSVYYCTLDFLQFISVHLPNLEYLDLPFIFERSLYKGHIHFNSVKHLKIRAIGEHFAQRATFKQLQELELDSNVDVSSAWIEFIGRSNNLTKLNIAEGAIFDAELAMLTEKVPNLIEASFIVGPGVKYETIVAFLQRNIKLKRVDLICYPNQGFLEPKFNAFKNSIERDWNISAKLFGYLIERKY